jgi:hypothetical protein
MMKLLDLDFSPVFCHSFTSFLKSVQTDLRQAVAYFSTGVFLRKTHDTDTDAWRKDRVTFVTFGWALHMVLWAVTQQQLVTRRR